ncbi:hypothetical protein HHK36_022325 [Tetracentron sinense]|uniref:Uncharacterized protein n=1 Tax=Tetracentron sinense TaxID=13715 RepID=A0A834YPM3_TETSI|nr:hypothetical protein HHK36_022325 [Tetracentron sinense]
MIVLHCADIVAVYTMWVLMTYLTDVWKLSITHAAAIVNIYSGLVGIMPIVMAFLLDHCLSTHWMQVLSSITYSIGLSFLTMSTPPVLSKITGTCSAYEPACIGNTQSILFYAALALIAVGMSSQSVSKISFRKENQDNYSNHVGFREYAVMFVMVAAIISVSYIKPWSVRFGIPAICTVVATLMFLSTSCFRPYIKPPQTSASRCEDTTISLLSSQTVDERGLSLLTTSGVDETSIILRIIPMWIAFIVCGIVISVGNTYFLAQANHMNRKLGSLHIPVEFLLWYYRMAKWTKHRAYEKAKTKVPAALLASVPLFNCILCCIIAALVESKRLHVVQKYGLIDKPEATIPMSMFWLLPQLSFLGAIENNAGEILTVFCSQEVPNSMKRYLPFLTEAVLGAGTIGSVLSVYIVNKKLKCATGAAMGTYPGVPSWCEGPPKATEANRKVLYPWGRFPTPIEVGDTPPTVGLPAEKEKKVPWNGPVAHIEVLKWGRGRPYPSVTSQSPGGLVAVMQELEELGSDAAGVGRSCWGFKELKGDTPGISTRVDRGSHEMERLTEAGEEWCRRALNP